MKFNKCYQLTILAAGLFLGCLSASAYADTVAITIQKWTSGFGSLTSSSGPMVVDESDGVVQSFGGSLIWGSGSASDPFSGSLDMLVSFGLDSTDTDQALLESNIDVAKHNPATDTTAYWLKIFVEKVNTSPASPGFSNPGSSGSTISVSTDYAQTTPTATTGTMKSTVLDSSNSTLIGSVSIPGAHTIDTVNFLRSSSTYDIKQEYDINLSTTKTASVEAEMTTEIVPEPSWTILSMLVGMGPMAYVVRSFRRRKSTAK